MKKCPPAVLAAGLALIALRPAFPANNTEAQAKPTEILFKVQLILGSASDKERTDEALKDDPVIREIRKFMPYRNFSLLDEKELRARENAPLAVILGKQQQYVLALKAALRKGEKGESIQTEVRFGYNFPDQKSADLIRSTVPLTPGERTVLGVSKPEGVEPLDQGLILIVTGRPVR